MVEFQLLGPLRARIDSVSIPLPPGRPLGLLTALLMGQGRRLSCDRLVTALWEEPPASAASNLRTYLTRIRHLLGPDSDRLTSIGGGYALTVHPDEVDLDRWQRAQDAAARATAEGAPADAADHLAAALALWRGAAADGVPRYGAVGRSLDALDEERRGAVERHARACIDAGRFGIAIDALRSFVTEHPSRELAWQYLMLALMRTGDRVGALAAYAAAREALVAEVGIEPGAPLRELQQTLLADDRRPPAPAAAEPGPAAEVRMLPPDCDLVGRADLLRDIAGGLTGPGSGIVALHGPAGIGKSALAVRAAWTLAPRYPGGQLYLDMRGSSTGTAPITLAEALSSLLRALGTRNPGGSTEEMLTLLRTQLTDRRVLLILDNVVDAAQVRRLLTSTTGAGVLLTSRRMLSALDVRLHLAVDELTPDASLALLRRYGGGSRVDAEFGAATLLSALCGHLPLALRIAGARLASRPDWPLAAMVSRLSDEQHRLDELATDDLAVRSGLVLTCAGLAERGGGADALAMFDRWGTVCAPVLGLELAQVMAGTSAYAARAALDLLADARLIEPAVEVDQYRMHDLVRIFAMERGRLMPPDARERTIHRVRCHYLATTRAARDLVRVNDVRADDEFGQDAPARTFTDRHEALRWLEAERGNLVAAVRLAAGDGTARGDLFATRLAGEMYPFLPMSGYYSDWRELSELSLACARRIGSHDDETVALTHLAGAQARTGATEEAVATLRTALALRERTGGDRMIASILDHLGVVLTAGGELAEAVTCFHRAVAMHRISGDARCLGLSLNNLADVHLQLGESEDALRHLYESLDLRWSLDDQLGIGITMLTIGQVFAFDGRRHEALAWLGEALDAARDSGNREAEWRALTVRADVHREAGQITLARRDLTAALTVGEQIGGGERAVQVRRALSNLTLGDLIDRRTL